MLPMFQRDRVVQRDLADPLYQEPLVHHFLPRDLEVLKLLLALPDLVDPAGPHSLVTLAAQWHPFGLSLQQVQHFPEARDFQGIPVIQVSLNFQGSQPDRANQLFPKLQLGPGNQAIQMFQVVHWVLTVRMVQPLHSLRSLL